ncbi:hypothetical protein VP01_835g4 [Puccinia sorghi]|uniref:Uncharacterized protein n=1 Tax=Puccinia sorghi TaxID=27349 RepID=A0A0L6UAD5_9BASI|nr:hypothetical protein VP01_835g4 [Puccinia sorghi]
MLCFDLCYNLGGLCSNYVIATPIPVNHSEACATNNKIFCVVITQTINVSKLRYFRKLSQDTLTMWSALLWAQQDLISGVYLYWIQKLLLSRMQLDNMLEHIETIVKYQKTLVTSSRPLLPEKHTFCSSPEFDPSGLAPLCVGTYQSRQPPRKKLFSQCSRVNMSIGNRSQTVWSQSLPQELKLNPPSKILK